VIFELFKAYFSSFIGFSHKLVNNLKSESSFNKKDSRIGFIFQNSLTITIFNFDKAILQKLY